MKKSSLIFFLLVSFSAQALDSGWDVKFCFTNKDKVDLHCYKQRDDLYSFEFFLDTQHENYHFIHEGQLDWMPACSKRKKSKGSFLKKNTVSLGKKSWIQRKGFQ
jgi:hypothetical protein